MPNRAVALKAPSSSPNPQAGHLRGAMDFSMGRGMLLAMSDLTYPLSMVVQILILTSLGLIVLVPLYLAYLWAVQRPRGANFRRLLVVTAFVGGFFSGGLLGWVLLPPPRWKLSFLNTIRASMDPLHTYGHQIGHGAEFLLEWVLVFAVGGGLLSAMSAHLGIRRGTPVWHD